MTTTTRAPFALSPQVPLRSVRFFPNDRSTTIPPSMAPKAKGDLTPPGPDFLVHELDLSPPPSPGDSPYPQDPYKLFEHASFSPTTTVDSRLRSGSDTIPDAIISSLKFLLSASEAVPFPAVAIAAQLALTVLEKVSQVKQNKKAFIDLAYTAGDVIRTVSDVLRQQIAASGADISQSFHSDIDKLLSTIKAIHDLVCHHVGRGYLKRFFGSNNDLNKISQYQESLKTAQDQFQLSSTVGVRATVERIERKLSQRPLYSSTPTISFANHGNGVVNNVTGVQNNSSAYHNCAAPGTRYERPFVGGYYPSARAPGSHQYQRQQMIASY